MRKKKKQKKGENLRLGILFSFLVIFLIALSLAFKIGAIVKESRFDGNSLFTVNIGNKELISFSPKTSSIFILNTEGKVGNPGKFIGVPVDGFFVEESFDFNKENITSNLLLMLPKYKDSNTNLTILDITRLYLFSRTVQVSEIGEETVSMGMDALELGNIISNFSDPEIVEEKKSIQVINATDTPGLGSRLANLITNMGGNVILVTSQDLQDKSVIEYSGERGYTVNRLKGILRFNVAEAKEKSVADVIITIGEDVGENLPF